MEALDFLERVLSRKSLFLIKMALFAASEGSLDTVKKAQRIRVDDV